MPSAQVASGVFFLVEFIYLSGFELPDLVWVIILLSVVGDISIDIERVVVTILLGSAGLVSRWWHGARKS